VRDVVGHLIATAQTTPPAFFGRMIAHGFRLPAMVADGIRKTITGRTDAELAELYRSLVNSRNAPPGPAASWLGETIVHGEDIFRAIGAYRDHPPEHLSAVADFYAGSNLLIGAKNRISGVRLEATDAGWRHGTGPAVSGPAVAIVMAMTGRQVALDDLSGPGVAILRDRP
jgi:uncharacterized protein (TIGR03083 family)